MAMSAAVFTPSLALRCCSSSAAAPQQPTSSSNSSSSTNGANSVKLSSLSAAAMQPVSSVSSVLHPGLELANLMWFRGSYNAQVFVGEDEPADSVVRRFRKAVMQAGVIPECRRRRFHETPQDIVKRKQQNARRRKTSGRRFTGPRPEGGFGDKKEAVAANNDDDDFWGYAEEGADVNL